MHETPIRKFIECEARPLAVILGTNEIASAIAARLTYNGHRVILSQDPFTPVLRRKMAFHDALFDEHVEVDGILGRGALSLVEIAETFARAEDVVAVTPLQLTDLMVMRRLDALVDARLRARSMTPDLRGFAFATLGVGPRFETGRDCDCALKIQASHVDALLDDEAVTPNHVTRPLGVASPEPFIRAQRDGVWLTPLDIGARVYKGIALGRHAGLRVFAPSDGVLLGIARDGAYASKGARLVEIDLRGRTPVLTGSDEHGRTIANAAMRAIRSLASRRQSLAASDHALY
ncbi:MAG: xanthine dehydrogenase [Methylocystis sp.]